ncbi:hypothetical protein AB5N19_12625 [Seiridium cardinale]
MLVSTALGVFAALLPMTALAATTKTTTSTASFFLPSRSMPAGYHIYATPITSDSSTTQYLLACQSQFDVTSNSCGGDFNGLTLTYGPSSMHLNLGPTVGLEYNCKLSPAVCTVTSSGIVASSTVLSLASSETPRSITAVTVLDDGRIKGNGAKTTSTTMSSTKASSTGTAATTTSTGGSGGSVVCKRKVTNGGDNGGSGGSGDDGATAAGGDAAATTTAGTGSGDTCSAGNRFEIGVLLSGMTVLGVVVGMVVL